MIESIVKEFAGYSEVEAITMGGSRGRGQGDEHSDYDIYIYLNERLSIEKRKIILERYCSYIEAGNTFWEEEDDCILKSGTDIEFIYRDLEDMAGNLKSVVDEGRGSMGYTTCFWESLIDSEILYDREGKMKTLVERYSVKYPERLKKNIIEKNHKLLKDHMPSLYYQIEKAVKRDDLISINHRITEFMAMYFDIIFAVNEKKHTGEKRILETTKKFEILPEDYERLIEEIFEYIYRDNNKMLEVLDKMSINIYRLLKKKGYSVEIESYRG